LDYPRQLPVASFFAEEPDNAKAEGGKAAGFVILP